jgi:hypothetical protein
VEALMRGCSWRADTTAGGQQTQESEARRTVYPPYNVT